MPEVPASAPASWKARAIVTQTGSVDFPLNRAGYTAPLDSDRRKLARLLDIALPGGRISDMIGDLLRDGTMQTRTAKDFVLHSDDEIEVVANTNASAGYCYVAAWLKSA